jgi:hypothetical protein
MEDLKKPVIIEDEDLDINFDDEEDERVIPEGIDVAYDTKYSVYVYGCDVTREPVEYEKELKTFSHVEDAKAYALTLSIKDIYDALGKPPVGTKELVIEVRTIIVTPSFGEFDEGKIFETSYVI